MPPLAVLLLAVLLGGFAQGAVGFSFGMITMALLPLAMEVQEAVAVVAVLGVLVAGFVLWRHRAHARRREVLPLVGGGLVGTPLGVLFLGHANARVVEVCLGLVLVAYAGRALLRERAGREGRTTPLSRLWALPLGFLGGLFGAAFNVGGPPALLYAAARRWPPGAFQANLQSFFLSVSVVQISLFAATGIVTPRSLGLDLVAVPAVGVGVVLGHRLGSRLEPATFRRLVLVLLLLLGAVGVARALA